jgi:hypothetical protein
MNKRLLPLFGLAVFALDLSVAAAQEEPGAPKASEAPKEAVCNDRKDDDGDGLVDCADADCFESEACKTSGGLENTNELCKDFVDNDDDGAVDCEDVDCTGPGLTACHGSWQGPVEGTGATSVGGQTGGDLPELQEGMTVEDLIGKFGDIDGERNDFVCSDGVDNDSDNAVDCADNGCRFDPNVTVCRGMPGLRFSVVANAYQAYDFETEQSDTRFRRLQLRAFGLVPGIQDAFFLISMLTERTPRLTFAMFTMPIYRAHKISLNSGGGGLSNALVLSVHKNPMLDPAFYVYNAFEAGNGAALEFTGPILAGFMDYRVFVAGGGGRFNGNIGGRFLNFDQLNYAWGVGGQVALYLAGRFDRWDSRYLYTEVPLGLTAYIGARFDEREFDRFPAANINVLWRWWIFEASLEAYGKRELAFGAWQGSFNFMAGVLIWPKHLFLSGDVGLFRATEYDDVLPDAAQSELTRVADQEGFRVALHWYIWRNNGLLTLFFRNERSEQALRNEPERRTNELRLEAQVRF